MHSIQLSDQLYSAAQRHAADAGFGSVDEFIADLVRHELDTPLDSASFFTPDRLTLIDQAVAEIDEGLGIPADQVDEHFRRKFGE